MVKIHKKVFECIEEIIFSQKERKRNWKETSTYERLRTMSSIDDKGEVGEMLLFNVLYPIYKDKVIWEKAVTKSDKDWDIIINNKKIEVKTATMGNTSKTFQHEKFFKNRKYDAVVFLDFTPDDLYITYAKKSDIIWDNLHKRKVNEVETSEFKFDFSLKNLKENKINKLKKHKTKLIKTEKDLINFFREIFKEELK